MNVELCEVLYITSAEAGIESGVNKGVQDTEFKFTA